MDSNVSHVQNTHNEPILAHLQLHNFSDIQAKHTTAEKNLYICCSCLDFIFNIEITRATHSHVCITFYLRIFSNDEKTHFT